MKKIFLYYCLTHLAVYGCSDDSGNLAVPDEPSFDDLVYQNCLTVQAAAEAYADVHGDYPYFVCDRQYGGLPAGLIHFLPDSTALANPRTGQRTEPVMFEPSGVGSVSYRVFAEYDTDMEWNTVGYYIVGIGLYQNYVLTNIANPDIHIQREQLVIENIFTLIEAINDYISCNAAEYPVDGDDECIYMHFALIDLLPGAELLLNPYTNERTEPSIWTHQKPVLPGQMSYGVYDADGNGAYDGCQIQAVGGYPPNRISILDKGHWLEDGYLGMAEAGYCTEPD